MAFDPPADVVAAPDEREMLVRYLHLQRRLVVWATIGLTDEQAHWRPDNRLIPVIGIVNHLTQVEARWIDGSYLRQPAPWRTEEEFAVERSRTLAEVVDAYAVRAEATDRSVRDAPGLEVACVGPPDLGLDIDLRWVLLHLITETAHHAGHADATREMLDGRQSGW
jgi:uncharacterized damage-inducible protein DinB